jgi:sialic acid synthase SpsE/mannose-6-phosphate isomerase-like protein (cupin superfamily)
MNTFFNKPFFIFEMANNHMGDVTHGIEIINKVKIITDNFPEFLFGFKLQYRDDSFFHYKHSNRKDHKLIKRFTETKLNDKDFTLLVNHIKKNNYVSICTPWDELAVDYVESKNFDIIKVASCSFNDWNLLEKIVTKNRFIIASTAGATKLEIDKVYSFFKHKNKNFSFMYCVGEYPTVDENLELNQITYLRDQYKNIKIGWSTHEDPDNQDSIKIAIAKGASIFEKHVGLKNNDKNYELNKYSANPDQIKNWLENARKAYLICGNNLDKRKNFSQKELNDLRILYRGAYASKKIFLNENLSNNFYLAMPNIEGQLVAKDLGQFAKYISKKTIEKDEPLLIEDFILDNERANIEDNKFIIKDKIIEAVNKSNIILPKNVIAEISHHYGIDNFFNKGAVLFHIINKEYCKIIIMMFAKQEYPAHFHELKDETYFIISGDLIVNYEDQKINLGPGDTINIDKKKIHSFSTFSGVIFEEIGTKYIKGDSKYIDKNISNRNRKSYINLYNDY